MFAMIYFDMGKCFYMCEQQKQLYIVALLPAKPCMGENEMESSTS